MEKYSKNELRRVSINAMLPVYLERVRRVFTGKVSSAMLTTEEIRSVLCSRGRVTEFLDNGETRILDFSNYDIKPFEEKHPISKPVITEIKVNDPTSCNNGYKPVNNTFFS